MYFLQGCYEVGKSVIYEISGYLIGTGIAMIILVVSTKQISCLEFIRLLQRFI